MIVTRRRWRTGRGNYMGAWLVAQLWPLPWAGPVLPCRLDAFFNAALPGMADHRGRNGQGLHNCRILPARRSFQQNPCSRLPARSTLSLAQQDFQYFNIIVRQRHSILDGRPINLHRFGDGVP